MGEPVVVTITTIKHKHAALGQIEGAGNGDIALLAFGDHGIVRQLSVMVEREMDFDGALSGFVLRPVEDLGTQMDRAVQTKKAGGYGKWCLGRDCQFYSQMRHQSGE